MVVRPQKNTPEEDALVILSEPLITGIVNRFKAQFIPDSAASELNNNDLNDPTRPARRDGYIATGAVASPGNKRISASVNYYPPANANRRVYVAANGANIYGSSNLTSWAVVTGGPFDVGTDSARMFGITDGVYVIPAVATPPAVINNSGAITSSANNSNTCPPTGGVDGCFAMYRAWILTNEGQLHFSRLLPSVTTMDSDWAKDGLKAGVGGRFILSPYQGGRPVAIKPWKDQSMMVFYDRYVEEMVVTDFTDAFFNLQEKAQRHVIEPSFGTPARDTVVSIGQAMYFLDQYGEFRELKQTVTGEQAGVSPMPVSEPIKEILPGLLNMSAISKAVAINFRDKIYLRFPMNTLTSTGEAVGEVVLDLGLTAKTGNPVWTAFNVYPASTGTMFTSQLRSGAGGAEELFFTDGGNSSAPWAPTTMVYRMFPQTFTDAGKAIPWQHTTKAYDCGAPHLDKICDTIEVDVLGDSGTSMRVDVQVGETGIWEELSQHVLVSAGLGSYPLTYPLAYPISDNPVGITRKAISVAPQLQRQGRGRTHRFRFREATSGKRFQLTRWHATVRAKPPERHTGDGDGGD